MGCHEDRSHETFVFFVFSVLSWRSWAVLIRQGRPLVRTVIPVQKRHGGLRVRNRRDSSTENGTAEIARRLGTMPVIALDRRCSIRFSARQSSPPLRRREVFEHILDLFEHALVPLRWLRRLMDTFRLDATPEQLTAPGVFDINRQRALQLRINAAVPPSAPPAATVVRPAISDRRIRTPPVAGPAEVAVFHLETFGA